MRTTITIDPDVAVLLARIQKARRASFKQVVNDALREGLMNISEPRRSRKSHRTSEVDLGRLLIGNLDNISEVLFAL